MIHHLNDVESYLNASGRPALIKAREIDESCSWCCWELLSFCGYGLLWGISVSRYVISTTSKPIYGMVYSDIQSWSETLALSCFKSVFCLTVLTHSWGITRLTLVRHKVDIHRSWYSIKQTSQFIRAFCTATAVYQESRTNLQYYNRQKGWSAVRHILRSGRNTLAAMAQLHTLNTSYHSVSREIRSRDILIAIN